MILYTFYGLAINLSKTNIWREKRFKNPSLSTTPDYEQSCEIINTSLLYAEKPETECYIRMIDEYPDRSYVIIPDTWQPLEYASRTEVGMDMQVFKAVFTDFASNEQENYKKVIAAVNMLGIVPNTRPQWFFLASR